MVFVELTTAELFISPTRPSNNVSVAFGLITSGGGGEGGGGGGGGGSGAAENAH